MIELPIIKLALLVILILVFIIFSPYFKTSSSSGAVFEGFQSSDGTVPTDADNPNLGELEIYGEVPSSASISIFKKAEARGATANPDALQVNENTGAVEIPLTEVPEQPADPEDIETILNTTVEGFISKEGFQGANTINVGIGTSMTNIGKCPDGTTDIGTMCRNNRNMFLVTPKPFQFVCPPDRENINGLCYPRCPTTHPNRDANNPSMCSAPAPPPAPAAATAAQTAGSAAQASINQQLGSLTTASGAIQAARNPLAFGIGTAVGAGAAALGVGAGATALGAAVGGGAAGAVAAKGAEIASAEVQGQIQGKAEDKVMELVRKKSKRVVAKAQKAKRIALKGAKKVATKISNKLSQKLGKTVLGKVMARVAKKIGETIGKKAALATAKGAGMSASVVMAPIGILLSVIAAIGVVLQIAIAAELKGDEGVCDPGWTRVSEKWPSYLDNIPGVGDIMGALAPYMCYMNDCGPDKEESAGLCYDKCRPGFKSNGLTLCYKQYPEFENNGQLHTITNITKKVVSNPGVPLSHCNNDEDKVGALCYEKAPAGWKNEGGTIWQNCPPGHTDTGIRCERLVSTPGYSPSYGGCNPGYRTDPLTCHRDAKCNTYECGRNRGAFGEDWGPKLCTNCIGTHTYDRSRSCGNGDLIGALCYPKCPEGTSRNNATPYSCSGSFTKQSRVLAPRPLKCRPGLEKKGELCYDPVPPGYTMQSLGLNSQNCPPGAKDVGVACERENYDRGIGKPKLQLRMVKPTPPPPPPPPSHFSSYYADDPETKCFLDFSSSKALGDMAQFYYRASRINADENNDGTITFSYISKITKVVASSEQSADVLCDITTINMNTDTGKVNSTNTTPNNDRRFYFAVIDKTCSFIVTAATNVNGSGPDVKNPDTTPKDVNFVPNLDKCKDIPISLKRCQNPAVIEEMMKRYTSTQSQNIRIKSITGAQNLSSNTCGLSWTEALYDPANNTESTPVNKSAIFTFNQDKSNEACTYKLQRVDPATGQTNIKPLDKPIVYELPIPNETTLQGCQTKCSDPGMIRKLINAYNSRPNIPNKILAVKKAFTGGPLRCDIEADVFVKATNRTESQRIRFDLSKDGASCVFNVVRVGDAGSGTFIQNNTPALGSTIETKDYIVKEQEGILSGIQSRISGLISQITGKAGKANQSFEKSLADVGQIKTLGNCSKKCSDPDVLDAIVSHYNTTNYPRERMNVTKKSIERVLKAATSGTNSCDITFEEKQEFYTDLYGDVPKVTMTQKTQRFQMKQGDNCTFSVNNEEELEGFQDTTGGGLPGMKRVSFVNSQSPLLTPPFTSKGCELDCSKKEVMDSMRDLYASQNIEGFSTKKTQKKVNTSNQNKKYLTAMYSTIKEAFQEEDEYYERGNEGEYYEGGYEEYYPEEGVTNWETQEQEYTEYAEEPTYEEGTYEEGTYEEPTYEEGTYEEPTYEEGTYEEPTYEEGTYAEETPTEEQQLSSATFSTTLKTVQRALKTAPDTCEYEITYDKSSTDEYGTVTDETGLTGYVHATFTKDPAGCSFSASSVTKQTEPIMPTIPSERSKILNYTF